MKEVTIVGIVLSALVLASTVCQSLIQVAHPPREPPPPALLFSEEEIFSEEEMERFLDTYSDQAIESTIEKYESAMRNGSVEDAGVQANIIASEYRQLGDEANHQKWKAKAVAEWATEFAE